AGVPGQLGISRAGAARGLGGGENGRAAWCRGEGMPMKWMWVLFVLAAGCVGQGTGTVAGNVHVSAWNQRDDLNAEMYSMDPGFFVDEPIEDINQNGFPHNRLEIRVQATSANLGGVVTSLDNGAGVDTLFVSISDVHAVAAVVGQPILLTPI